MISKNNNVFFIFDPPYYLKQVFNMNSYETKTHKNGSEKN